MLTVKITINIINLKHYIMIIMLTVKIAINIIKGRIK